MKGLSFEITEDDQLSVAVDPLICELEFTAIAFTSFLEESEYSDFQIKALALQELLDELIEARDSGSFELCNKIIGLRVSHHIEVILSDDKMSATVKVKPLSKEVLPTSKDINNKLSEIGISRGISKKAIDELLHKVYEGELGTSYEQVIAQGLPARNGKDSRMLPLVPNALDRVLTPQKKDDNKVDMRNLGDVICVDSGAAVAKRLPPSNGRAGYTVTDEVILANQGKWIDIKLGDNTEISEENPNLVVASVAGLPKFTNNVMVIDQTYVCEGVNVKTGNINYQGAVIVNGDVTEQMQIIADGDVTINGFVESALIRAGGDIIITQGATGKMDEVDCQLYASGNIFIQHGQGLDIISGKELHVGRQLAYSRVKSHGRITVGNPERPNGSVFASKITAFNTIRAGIVGAVSGSKLEIDFSSGLDTLQSKLESISEMHAELRKSNADHVINASKIKAKLIPKSLWAKMRQLTDELEKEQFLLEWLDRILDELHEDIEAYRENAKVLAYSELFPGVKVKLNKTKWKANTEYLGSRILLKEGKWKVESM